MHVEKNTTFISKLNLIFFRKLIVHVHLCVLFLQYEGAMSLTCCTYSKGVGRSELWIYLIHICAIFLPINRVYLRSCVYRCGKVSIHKPFTWDFFGKNDDLFTDSSGKLFWAVSERYITGQISLSCLTAQTHQPHPSPPSHPVKTFCSPTLHTHLIRPHLYALSPQIIPPPSGWTQNKLNGSHIHPFYGMPLY